MAEQVVDGGEVEIELAHEGRIERDRLELDRDVAADLAEGLDIVGGKTRLAGRRREQRLFTLAAAREPGVRCTRSPPLARHRGPSAEQLILESGHEHHPAVTL